MPEQARSLYIQYGRLGRLTTKNAEVFPLLWSMNESPIILKELRIMHFNSQVLCLLEPISLFCS